MNTCFACDVQVAILQRILLKNIIMISRMDERWRLKDSFLPQWAEDWKLSKIESHVSLWILIVAESRQRFPGKQKNQVFTYFQ